MRLSDIETSVFDYVIVGAGAAGCALANKLSEDPKVTICLLESGPSNNNIMLKIPAGSTKVLGDEKYTWQFDTEPTPETGNRAIHLIQGRVLGGSTSINGQIYIRGQKSDYDGWAELGNPGWGYDDILSYFRALENRPSGDPAYRGTSGPLDVTDLRWRDPVCEAFIKAAVENGMPINPDYNAKIQHGVAYVQTTIFKRRRVSSATAFLRPAAHRKNLSVLTGATAEKIKFSEKRAIGIQYRQGDQVLSVTARREVVISAGSLNTARLLQVSGIGDPSWLNDIGVPVVSSRSGVGKNLHDHFMCLATASGQNFRSINHLASGPQLWVQIVRYFLGATSILELPPPLIHWFEKSAAAGADADIEGVFTPASLIDPAEKGGKAGMLDKSPGMTLGFWQHLPHSRGFVKAVSTDISKSPIIQPNYLQHEIDRAAVVHGYRRARSLLQSNALSPFVKDETAPGLALKSDDELLAYASQTGGTAYHFVGTAKMGREDDPGSVVDSQLRVYGVDRLRVVDASIMPRITSANTQATTMVIGLKAADMIRKSAALENLAAE